MHNHSRMYVAGITCNRQKLIGFQPPVGCIITRWMATRQATAAVGNGWQAVSLFEKHIANQENVNYYLKSNSNIHS